MPSDIDPRIFFASLRIFSSSLSMKGTTFAVMSRDGTPGYPAPESAWYVATCTSVRSSAERRDDVVLPEDTHVERLKLYRGDVRGERNVFEPPEVFEVSADLSLGRREGGDLERGVVLEQAHESLADISGRPQDCNRNLAQRDILPSKFFRVWPMSRRKSAPFDAVAFCHSSSVSRIRRWMNGVWGFNAWMSLNSVGESAKSPAAAIERRENVVPAELSRPARSNGLSATHRANVKRQSWLSPKRNAIDSSW